MAGFKFFQSSNFPNIFPYIKIMSKTTVAPKTWHQDVDYDIKVSNLLTTNAKEHIQKHAVEDRQLKTLRQFLLESNNQQLHEYFRDVRELIVLLREKFLETNNFWGLG